MSRDTAPVLGWVNAGAKGWCGVVAQVLLAGDCQLRRRCCKKLESAPLLDEARARC